MPRSVPTVEDLAEVIRDNIAPDDGPLTDLWLDCAKAVRAAFGYESDPAVAGMVNPGETRMSQAETIEVGGLVPRAAEHVTETGDLMLTCRLRFENGALVGINFATYEYFVVGEERGSHRVLTRPAADITKFPSWPDAEPEAA